MQNESFDEVQQGYKFTVHTFFKIILEGYIWHISNDICLYQLFATESFWRIYIFYIP